MREELLTPEETPFNLAGELLDNSPSAEGEARAQAEAEAEARKRQLTFDDEQRERERQYYKREHERDLEDESRRDCWEHDGRDWDCTGTWDGISVGSDADSGL